MRLFWVVVLFPVAPFSNLNFSPTRRVESADRSGPGIPLISLPTAIVGAKFQQVYQEVENERKATEDGRRVAALRSNPELKTEHNWTQIDWGYVLSNSELERILF